MNSGKKENQWHFGMLKVQAGVDIPILCWLNQRFIQVQPSIEADYTDMNRRGYVVHGNDQM